MSAPFAENLMVELMPPEQIQRTMDFILQNQADSAVRIAKLEEGFVRMQAGFERLEAKFEQQQMGLDRLHNEITDLIAVMSGLVQVSRIHNDRLNRLEGTR